MPLIKMPCRCEYSTRVVLATSPQGSQEVILPHSTLAEVKSYIHFNGLILGVPRPGWPYVEVLHFDGSKLTDQERGFLGDTRKALAEKERDSILLAMRKAR